MQVCISIGTDIHINTNMKMIVCIRRRIHVYISNSVMHVRIRLNIGAILINTSILNKLSMSDQRICNYINSNNHNSMRTSNC